MNEPIPKYDEEYCNPPKERKATTDEYEVTVTISVRVYAFDEEQAKDIAKATLGSSLINVIDIENVEKL